MLDNLVTRYSMFLVPWNILQNYYIKKDKWETYSLTDWIFENMVQNESNFNNLFQYIQQDIEKYKKKWFKLKNRTKTLNEQDIQKLFKIKFWINKKDIERLETENYVYYVSDTTEYKNDNLYTERNVIFFTKLLNEYIWRFTITLVDDHSSIWSIFITTSKQRQSYFTTVLKEDLKYFIQKGLKEVAVFQILKKGLWFYKKMEKEWYFQFTKWEVDWVFYLK